MVWSMLLNLREGYRALVLGASGAIGQAFESADDPPRAVRLRSTW